MGNEPTNQTTEQVKSSGKTLTPPASYCPSDIVSLGEIAEDIQELKKEHETLFDKVSKVKDFEKMLKEVEEYETRLRQDRGDIAYNSFINSKGYEEILSNIFEKIDKSSDEFKQKVNGYIWAVKRNEKEIELLEERKKYFETLIKSKKSFTQRLVDNLQYSFERLEIEKLETGDYSVSFRKQPEKVFVLDETFIPFEFFKVEEMKTLEKNKLKDFLKNGGQIDEKGAYLGRENPKLNIK